MKTYYFEVTETLSKTVAVDAEDFEEAYEKVEEAFNLGEKEVTWDDFLAREIENRTKDYEGCVERGLDLLFIEKIE